MDLTQSKLSLGFLSHSSHGNEIANDTVSFQIDSSYPHHLVPGVPLQLMEQQTTPENKNVDLNDKHQQTNAGSIDLNEESKVGGGEEEEDKDRDVEEFQILGHSMCLKRWRDNNSTCATTDSACSNMLSKRCHTEQSKQDQSLESRRQSVRAWGNQSLQTADPDIFEILEKEKQRQYKGIELIASENFVCKAVMESLKRVGESMFNPILVRLLILQSILLCYCLVIELWGWIPLLEGTLEDDYLTELQNARGIMDVHAEMLTAIDPEKKELKEEKSRLNAKLKNTGKELDKSKEEKKKHMMELDDFEPLFGEPKVEWSTASPVMTPIRPFLFQVDAQDSSSLGVNVTDFFSDIYWDSNIQLNGVRLVDDGLRARFKAAFLEVEVQPQSPPSTRHGVGCKKSICRRS
ncbi:hypothetical protein L6452_35863 [Arctium lappa]|uniref:Uncharacterized protein n=1 Tax=Arctium lappa TaxID=4217 RepID=A0ACB8Y8C6_ARCLA|nr:hypothetical protein L6452_35863 [Arctium lappa]